MSYLQRAILDDPKMRDVLERAARTLAEKVERNRPLMEQLQRDLARLQRRLDADRTVGCAIPREPDNLT